MDNDPALVCPRPRVRRACENCRSRKIRCLPEKEQGVCRRCAKFGLDCVFKDSLDTPCRKPNQPPNNSREISEEARGHDFVSRLLQPTPAKDDELSAVRNKHHQIFQEQFACEDLVGTSLTGHENQSVHKMRTGNPGLENSDMGMQEADELLSLFREQHHYFPFVTVSDTTSSQEMAMTSPFLLLAILTVCSTKRPRLHRRTEERFRRALGDNIIVHGEKSLEYVQGLLVYLGWYPFYLRPTSIQQLQYLRIAIGMCSDLKLSTAASGSAAWKACLGCYYLSSLFCAFKRQLVDETAQDLFKQTLPEEVISSLADTADVNYALLHKLLEDVCVRDKELNSKRRGCPMQTDSQDSQDDVDSFLNRLKDLELKLPSNTVSVRLKTQFLRMKIASLSMRQVNKPANVVSGETKKKGSPSTVFQHQSIESARFCFDEVQSFLETFLSTPAAEYYRFSIAEWFQLINAIVVVSRICLSHDLRGDIAFTSLKSQVRAKSLIYLESLAHRMGSLSVMIPGFPDVFCMFKSVLDLLIPLYAPTASNTGDQLSIICDYDTASSSCQTDDNVSTPGTSASRCPVINGSIKETEFWKELDNPGMWSNFNQVAQVGEDTGIDLDGVPPPSPDWPSIFSEWVVDFNALE